LTGQPDAIYTFSVVAIDAAGNLSPAATSDYRLLTTPPPAPVITVSPATPGNSRSPSWSFTTVAGTTTTCSLTQGATVVVASTSCTSPAAYDLTGQADAVYTFSVVAVDAAGNLSPAATSDYRLLTTPPTAPVITVAPSTPGNSRSPSWSFTTVAGTTTTCSLTQGATVVVASTSCTSPTAYDLTGQPDAIYTFSVVAIDAPANLSSAATSDYQLLTIPPPAPVITVAPATPGNSRSPSWSFTTVAGTTTTCSLTQGATVVVASTSCTSPTAYDLTGQPDAIYTFSVVAIDAAGNLSPAATSDYRLLTTPPPAPVITVAPATPGNSRSPAWSFTTVAGTTTTCSLTRGATVVVASTSCTSPSAYDLTGQPDAVYTFSVTPVDAAGNLSPAATSDYRLLTIPPPAPVITVAPATPGNSRSPSWSFTNVAGTTTTCSLPQGATVVVASTS